MSDWWECECGWSYQDGGLYYVENGETVDCTDFDEATKTLVPNKKAVEEGREVYPKYGTSNSNRWAAMEFGGNPVDWEETHRCPHCDKEFSFENSNY